MKKNKDRLKHALHNESVCNYLEVKQEFADWVITTAFYSALHFVSYKIFPFQVKSIQDKNTSIENLDQFSNYNNPKRKSKHELLAELVFKNCPKISEDYDWLLDMSMTARYSYYQHDKEIANKAKRLMTVVKNECVTKTELAEL